MRIDASGRGSARRRFDARSCHCRTRDDVPAGPVVPADQQRDGPSDTAGSSSALVRISIHVPDRRPTPPWTAQQDEPQRPQEQPLLPRLRPHEEGGQRGEPHPPRQGDAHPPLIVTHPQISDRAQEVDQSPLPRAQPPVSPRDSGGGSSRPPAAAELGAAAVPQVPEPRTSPSGTSVPRGAYADISSRVHGIWARLSRPEVRLPSDTLTVLGRPAPQGQPHVRHAGSRRVHGGRSC